MLEGYPRIQEMCHWSRKRGFNSYRNLDSGSETGSGWKVVGKMQSETRVSYPYNILLGKLSHGSDGGPKYLLPCILEFGRDPKENGNERWKLSYLWCRE